MKLEIILPPAPRGCDRNNGKIGIAASKPHRQARYIAKMRTLEAMRDQGVRAGETPLFMKLTVFDKTGKMDLDNAVATYKHYQDGIFDALEVNDRNIRELHAVKVISPAAHRWTRCVLTNSPHVLEKECCTPMEGVDKVLEMVKGDAR